MTSRFLTHTFVLLLSLLILTLRRSAADYRLPPWDYDLVAATLPGRGLDVDATHMLSFYAHDYNDPTAFTRGHAMHNLMALMMLDAVWREVMQK